MSGVTPTVFLWNHCHGGQGRSLSEVMHADEAASDRTL